MLEIFGITIISFFLGGFWFSPRLFGNIWARGVGREIVENHQHSKDKLLLLLLINLAISFFKTLCIWYAFDYTDNLAEYGIFCLIFIFFISSVHIQNLYFAKRNFCAVGVEWSYQIVDSIVISILLVLFIA